MDAATNPYADILSMTHDDVREYLRQQPDGCGGQFSDPAFDALSPDEQRRVMVIGGRIILRKHLLARSTSGPLLPPSA